MKFFSLLLICILLVMVLQSQSSIGLNDSNFNEQNNYQNLSLVNSQIKGDVREFEDRNVIESQFSSNMKIDSLKEIARNTNITFANQYVDKQKLKEAFEQYVDGLSESEIKNFDIYKKVKSNIGSSRTDESYYEIQGKSNEVVEILNKISETSLQNEEQELYGQPISMQNAIFWCGLEHRRRLQFRNEEGRALEQSVYFSFKNIEEWMADVKEKYPETPPVGFRAYFAGYPDTINPEDNINQSYAGRSTIVLRAMYLKEENNGTGSIAKIPWESTDASSGKDILTFNLGGLCPPKCQDNSAIQ